MTVIARRRGAVLRHATAADLPAIDAIAIACWTPIHQGFRELLGEVIYEERARGLPSWQENKCQQLHAHFERAPDQLWVIDRDGEVVAFVTFLLNDQQRIGSIGNNGVRPDAAGQGWGTYMYRHVLDHFRARGMRLATVHTGLDWGHAPARRAYEAVGFAHATPFVDYWMDLEQRHPGSMPEEDES